MQRNNPLPIFNAIDRPDIDAYDNWRPALVGSSFDPGKDRFIKAANLFPVQSAAGFGNATRYNPKVRGFFGKSENISLAKSFPLTESIKVDFRAEAFNLFNRTVFGTGSTSLNSLTIGQVTNQVNDPRTMQAALKIYW